MSSATNFPSTVDALDAAWLSSALGYEVRNFDVQHFSEGAGVIGLVTRVLLESDEGPSSIIAKFPSPVPENRAVAETYGMYEREVGFYRDIAARLEVRTPDCFFIGHDPTTQDFILLLEDMQDFQIGDQVTGCSLEEARAVVDAIAELHSLTWGATGLEMLISHNSAQQRDGMIGGFQLGWPVVMEQFADLLPQSALQAGEKMPGLIGPLLEAMCCEPVCLSHADVRLDNIFFGSNSEIVLVDWQSVCTSAPEQDLAYFLTQSVPQSVRQQEDLVARYHAALIRHGIDYSLTQTRERYRISALYLLCYAVVIAGTLDMGNERGRQLARTLLGNALTALDEMDAFDLLTANF